MPSKYGFGNTRKKSPVYKKPMYGEVQRNPIQKKMEALPGIDTKLDAKSPVRKMDPMHDGKPGIQKADFEQFSDKKSPLEKYANADQRKAVHASKAEKGSMAKMYGKDKK